MKLEPMLPPLEQPSIVHIIVDENYSLEAACHLLSQDRDLILIGTPDGMSGNEMNDVKTTKIGCIGFNPNVSTCTDRFNVQHFEDVFEISKAIDSVITHKPITHKPHKYGKGDWLSKRRR